MKNSFTANNRSQSLSTLRYTRNMPLETLAQKNLVSLKQNHEKYFLTRPLRILLPHYFNIPKFIDKEIDFQMKINLTSVMSSPMFGMNQQKGLKKKLKDLQILAQGMKRAKNIREQSRYYFIQGVILHNVGSFEKSIEMFQKFLKIVLFIKDDKSIELALNSIAIAYMYLNRPQDALHYHEKQYSLNENTQKFIGRINIALCHQMMRNKPTAHHMYSQLMEILPNDNDKRTQYLTNLIQRTNSSQPQNYFLTQNRNNQSKILPNLKNKSKSPQNHSKFYVNRSLQKSKNSLQFQNSFTRRKYQNQKVNYAIFSAQSSFNSYIKDVKDSFIAQK